MRCPNSSDPSFDGYTSKLARPIMVPVRQNFNVNAEWFTVGSADYRNGATSVNTGATDDEKVITFLIDG